MSTMIPMVPQRTCDGLYPSKKANHCPDEERHGEMIPVSFVDTRLLRFWVLRCRQLARAQLRWRRAVGRSIWRHNVGRPELVLWASTGACGFAGVARCLRAREISLRGTSRRLGVSPGRAQHGCENNDRGSKAYHVRGLSVPTMRTTSSERRFPRTKRCGQTSRLPSIVAAVLFLDRNHGSFRALSRSAALFRFDVERFSCKWQNYTRRFLYMNPRRRPTSILTRWGDLDCISSRQTDPQCS
jgi:hypothetical protein